MRLHGCPNCRSPLRVSAAEYIPAKGKWGDCTCRACGVRVGLDVWSRARVVLMAPLALAESTIAIIGIAKGGSHLAGMDVLRDFPFAAKLVLGALVLGGFFLVQAVAGSWVATWKVTSNPLRRAP